MWTSKIHNEVDSGMKRVSEVKERMEKWKKEEKIEKKIEKRKKKEREKEKERGREGVE